ncbi:MAG: hypothetical protein HY791_11725 [Deltaproteobacteria bacterium]|nr:hypothetical protein [Deltaproteobacteria bacterium]
MPSRRAYGQPFWRGTNTEQSGALVEVRDGSIASVELDWDDPSTPLLEANPVPEFWSIDRSGPVAWVAGRRALGRILLVDGPLVVEGFWLDRLSRGVLADEVERQVPPDVTAVRAYCPNDLVLGTVQYLAGDDDPFVGGQRIGALEACGSKVMKMCQLEGFNRTVGRSSDEFVVRFLGGARKPVLVMNEGTAFARGSAARALPFDHVLRATEGARLGLAAGDQGRLSVVLSP